jgi:putative endonuclease
VKLVDLPAGRQARQPQKTNKTKLANMYFTYALKSITRNYIYVGLTDDLDRRFMQHQKGWNKTTAPYRPFEIILQEKYKTRAEARAREKYLKSGCGKEWIKEYIKKKE